MVLFKDDAIPGNRALRNRFEKLRNQMRMEREPFMTLWRDLADYILPFRPRFNYFSTKKADRRSRKILDNTATLASRTASAGMQAGVTNPARPWFKLGLSDKNLAEVDSVKQWLDTVTRRMREVYLKTNIYQVLPLFYRDLVTYGTSAIYVQEDADDVIRYYPIPIGTYMLANDDQGHVSVCLRELRMSVRQVVDDFGKRENGTIDWSTISPMVRRLWEEGETEQWIEVIHVIAPNENFNPDALSAKFKRFVSVYYESGAASSNKGMTSDAAAMDRLLRESGYDLFPVLVGRWEVGGEDVYAVDCPGITALSDVKGLQTMEKRALQAVEKMVNPAMMGPASLMTKKVSLLAGDITYTDQLQGKDGLKPIHEVKMSLVDLDKKMQETRGRVRRAFFEDLFLRLSDTTRREITAREIQEIHQEKMVELGGILERVNQDFLNPGIDLTFQYMLNRRGLVPDPPKEIQGMELRVEYISVLAQAQKMTGLEAIERLVSFTIQLAQSDPTALDMLDIDAIIAEYAENIGIPPKLVLSEELVAQLRQARAEAKARQEQAIEVQQAIEGAKKLSETKVGGEGGNVLDGLLQQVQGAA